MFEALRPGRDDSVLDLRGAAVHALDCLRRQGDRFLDTQVGPVPLDDRLKRLVRGLPDREGRALERRAARVHLDQLDAEVVDARHDDRRAERAHRVHRELVQVLRQVPRERADVDRLVVDESVALGRDAELIEERRHIADVSAPGRADVVVHDEDFLRGLHQGPGRLHLARQDREVLRLQTERRRAAGNCLEGVVHLDEPTFLVVEERHPSHFRRHLSSPPTHARSGSRARRRRSRSPDRVPSPPARPLRRASSCRRVTPPYGVLEQGFRKEASSTTRRSSPKRPCGRRWNAIRGAGTASTCSRSRTGMRGRRTEMAAEMGRMPFFYNQEGRLVQVDYALQAVSRGSTTLGLKTKDFAVLTSQVKPTRPLMEPAEKVFVVDDHIGATGSGYIGDVTTLLDQLRVAAQRHRLVYDEPIDVGTLSRNLSEYLHEFTMYAVRPFGASIIVAGVDDLGVQLIQVDPSGTTFKGSAFAIGQSADEALDTIVNGYRPDLSVEQAIALSSQAIEGVNGGKTQIEHGVVTASAKRFQPRNNGSNAG